MYTVSGSGPADVPRRCAREPMRARTSRALRRMGSPPGSDWARTHGTKRFATRKKPRMNGCRDRIVTPRRSGGGETPPPPPPLNPPTPPPPSLRPSSPPPASTRTKNAFAGGLPLATPSIQHDDASGPVLDAAPHEVDATGELDRKSVV